MADDKTTDPSPVVPEEAPDPDEDNLDDLDGKCPIPFFFFRFGPLLAETQQS